MSMIVIILLYINLKEIFPIPYKRKNGLLYPNKVLSHATGWILTHPNAQVAAKSTIQ
jgi:hypothetical protein